MNIVETIINEIKASLIDNEVLHNFDLSTYTIYTEDNIFVIYEEDNIVKVFDNEDLCTIKVRLSEDIMEDLVIDIIESMETNEEKLERLYEEYEQVLNEKEQINIKINLTSELFNELPDFSSANQKMFDNKMESFQAINYKLSVRKEELEKETRDLENIILGE